MSSPIILTSKHAPGTTSFSTGQCDCACSAPVLSRTEMPLKERSPLFIPPDIHISPLGRDYKVLCNPLSGNLAVVDPLAFDLWQTFSKPRAISTGFSLFPQCSQIIIREATNQLWDIGLLQSDHTISHTCNGVSQMLVAWLHITDRCNLRCAYCYLSHSKGDMPLEIGQLAIQAILRSASIHNYSAIKLKYAGGEPLLNYALVIALHRYTQSLAEPLGITLEGIVLSNGTLLTPEIITALKLAGLRLMISLDNLTDCPGQQRIYPNGSSSVQSAIRGIGCALDLGLVPEISITISGRNARNLPPLVDWLLERELPFSINFYRDNGLATSHTDGLHLEVDEIITSMLAAYRVIEANLPNRSLLSSLLDRSDLSAPHLRTCGVGDSYLVIDPKGNVSKCQMQIDQPITNIWAHNPLILVQEDRTGVQNISVEQKPGCSSCKWRYWCTGGCPLAAYRETGLYNAKSPYCSIYQALIPEVIRLEGLRLLKHHLDNLVPEV